MQRKNVQHVETLLPKVHGSPCRRSGYSAQQSLVLHHAWRPESNQLHADSVLWVRHHNGNLVPALSMQASIPCSQACARHIGLGDRPEIRNLQISGSPLLRMRCVPSLPACQAALTNTMHPALLRFRAAAYLRSAYHVFKSVRATSDPAIAPVPKFCKRLAALCFASLIYDVFLRARPCPFGPCAATHCMAKHIRKTFAQPAQCLTMPVQPVRRAEARRAAG